MNVPNLDVDALIGQLNQLKQNLPKDEAQRRRWHQAARELLSALETPFDTVRRIAFSVSLQAFSTF